MPLLYDTVGRGLLFPLHRLVWRVVVEGAERIPATGPAVLSPNHESLLDAFFLGLTTRRRIHYMARAELWEMPLLPGFGRVLESFAAFPVRRGASDGSAIDAALEVLRAGHLVGVYPQGTCLPFRDRRWKRGAARLALEVGCPLVPVALVNTERALQPRTKKVGLPRVRVVVGESLLPRGPATPEAAEELTMRLERAVSMLRMPYGPPHHAWID